MESKFPVGVPANGIVYRNQPSQKTFETFARIFLQYVATKKAEEQAA